MRCGRAENGLLYAVKRSGNSVGYCSLTIKCGTRDEEGFHSGIAHFTEHTIFKGTSKRSAAVINSYLEKLGGELNAFTTKEEIVLHATVLKDDISKAANLLFELATDATFPDHEIETEKGVVIDEINSYKDTPSEDIYDRFEEMIFEGHPLSGKILGTARTVRKISGKELREFARTQFKANRIAFTLVADIDEGKMEKDVRRWAEKYFKVPENQNEGKSEMIVPQNHFDITLNKRNHQANCIIGSLAPSLYQEKERFATILLCNILGGPATNSILNYVLREKYGLVYGVECSYTQYADTGLVAICLGCEKDNLDKCLKIIDKELKKLMEQPLSEKKLKAAKKQLLGQLAISGDNGETQCLSMGKSLISYGKISSNQETRTLVEAITGEEVCGMARKLFREEAISRLTFI